MHLRNRGDADSYLARLQRGTDTVLDLSLCQSEACKHWRKTVPEWFSEFCLLLSVLLPGVVWHKARSEVRRECIHHC